MELHPYSAPLYGNGLQGLGGTCPAHPVAELFPMLEEEALLKLAENIERQGLLQPIVVLDGKILDGRNRWEACKIAGVARRYVKWVPSHEGESPSAYVFSVNLQRRHLDTTQRSYFAALAIEHFEAEAAERKSVAAARSNAQRGPNPDRANLPGPVSPPRQEHRARDDAAKAAGVSPRSVQTAKAIITADPERAKVLGTGKTSLNAEAQRIKTPKADKPQPSIVTQALKLVSRMSDEERREFFDVLTKLGVGK